MKRIFAAMFMACAAQSLVLSQTFNKQSAPNNNATIMSGWTHREGTSFDYYVPNEQWHATSENANGIDISSPTGNEVVSYAWAPFVNPSSERVEKMIFDSSGIENKTIVNRKKMGGSGAYLSAEEIEFTGVLANIRIHGKLTILIAKDNFVGKVIRTPEQLWQKDSNTLETILGSIKFIPKSS